MRNSVFGNLARHDQDTIKSTIMPDRNHTCDAHVDCVNDVQVSVRLHSVRLADGSAGQDCARVVALPLLLEAYSKLSSRTSRTEVRVGVAETAETAEIAGRAGRTARTRVGGRSMAASRAVRTGVRGRG